MLANIVVGFLGIFVFLFIFWKRLKDDYASDLIFRSSLYSLAGLFVGLGISFKLFPDYYFWIGMAGSFLGLGAAVLLLGLRFFETFESFIVSVLPWLALHFLGDSVISRSGISFLVFLGVLLIVFFAYYLDSHYKNFTWYKSGKVGFVGLVILATIFLLRIILAISQAPVLSLVKYEAVLSGIGVLTSLGFLIYLSKKQ